MISPVRLVRSRATVTHPNAGPLISKLSQVIDLSDDDVAALSRLCARPREVRAGKDLISEGDKPDAVILVLDGWACRYKLLDNGTRQITAFMLPGDFCDLNVMILAQMDHSIAAVTNLRMAFVSRDQFQTLLEDQPRLLRALWWTTLVDEGILRAWIVNNGRRTARERVAHLICELRQRLIHTGPGATDQLRLPVSQIEIADAVGLTPVHVNRVMRSFVAEGVVTMARGKSVIADIHALERIAGFDGSYLHAQRLRIPEYEASRS